MTMNTRKLLQTTNQSIDCLYFCDSSCPYGCYPYVDLDYYIPPPSPPPPPPPPQSSTNKHHINIPPYIIISAALFASLFLLVSYYLIIVKNCLNLNRRRSTPSSQGSNEDFFDENRVEMIDHPIWYINTVGLQPSVINNITIFKFKKEGAHGMSEGSEYCSVCLNEFQDDESLRLLPNCKHAFHIHCIDTWLRSHTNCPLCRAAIVTNTFNVPVVSIEPNLSTSLSTNEERLMENDAVGDGNRNVNSSDEENEVGATGDQEESLHIETLGISRKAVISKRGCVDGKVQLQPMRRSVSVDSSISTSIGLDMVVMSSMAEGENGRENSSSRIKKIVGSGSMRLSLHKESVLMKRSFSYSGRSFFSRHHRSRSSVLPL